MRVKSTGLGPTELVIEPEHLWLERQGGFLIVNMQSDEPVQWHLRTAIHCPDLWKIVWMTAKTLFRGAFFGMSLRWIFKGTKEGAPSEY